MIIRALIGYVRVSTRSQGRLEHDIGRGRSAGRLGPLTVLISRELNGLLHLPSV